MWKIISFLLFVLSVITLTLGDLELTFRHCCSLGKNKTLEPLKCEGRTITPIPGIAIEKHSVCLSTIDLCCNNLLRHVGCKNGKQAAKNGHSCDIPARRSDLELIHYRFCCEACKLGLIAGSMSSCASKTINFDSPWDETYGSCCREAIPTTATINNTKTIITRAETTNVCFTASKKLCDQICIPQKSDSYKCECQPGYTLMADGKSCREDVANRCDKNNPCDQNCFDNGVETVCSCNNGFTLLSDNKTCQDVNECQEQQHECNSITQNCINVVGSYRCVPKESRKIEQETHSPTAAVTSSTTISSTTIRTTLSGFVFDNKRKSYVDINECTSNPCNSNEICINNVGSYKCECAVGFYKDRITGACIDVNECQLNLNDCDITSQRCDNTIGSYHCVRFTSCGTGYTFNSQSRTCEDDDECVLGVDNCKYLGPDWVCRNKLGSFRCEKKPCANPLNCIQTTHANCPNGFKLNKKGTCEDIDECSILPCSSGQSCVNTMGSFACVPLSPTVCANGLRFNETLSDCVDIDECKEQSGICDHYCYNTFGSFKCSCNSGFLLHSDNRSCVDVNECKLAEHEGRKLCAGICVNQPGSYLCSCPSGYVLSADKIYCQDIDECVTESKCRNSNEICVNMRGSYRCNAMNCPPNYIQDKDRKNRCSRASYYCNNNDGECLKMPLSYSFNYISLVSNVPIPAAGQLEMFHMRGPVSGTSSISFVLELKQVAASIGVPKIDESYFYLNHMSSNAVTVSLIKSIYGPQDIELNLQMHVSVNGIYSGFTVSKLFIFVSQYEF